MLYKWVRLADIEHCFFQNACMRMYEGSSILTLDKYPSLLFWNFLSDSLDRFGQEDRFPAFCSVKSEKAPGLVTTASNC